MYPLICIPIMIIKIHMHVHMHSVIIIQYTGTYILYYAQYQKFAHKNLIGVHVAGQQQGI